MLDLNTIVVMSLAILAVFSLILIVIIVPLALQLSKTLSAFQSLLDTVNNDVSPTVKDIKESFYGVKDVLKSGTSLFEDRFSETSILFSSSMHGLLVGIKEYFATCKTDETGYNNNGSMNIRR